MSQRKTVHSTSPNRVRMLAGLLLLVFAGLIGFWKFSGNHDSQGAQSGGNRGGATSTGSSVTEVGGESEGPGATKSSNPNRGRKSGVTSGEVTQFPLVQRILSDSSLSEKQAAAGMAEIARRTDISQQERFEALAHGLNLDFRAVADLADDSKLPVELAQRFIDELANRNHFPKEQITGCLSLMKHDDAGIRDQAARELAFLLEAEALVSSPEELRKAAFDKIKALDAAPPEKDQTALGETNGAVGAQ